VALWTTQQKGTPVTTLTWPANSPLLPLTVYLEGTVASASPRDVVLTLTYNGDACDPPACECSDTVLVTVMHAAIIIDGPTTPGGGTLLGVGELVQMDLSQTPPTFDCDDLALTWDDDPQTRKVRLYDSPEKTTEYTSALVWGAGESPPSVYVEAVAPSDTLGDIVFTLTWTCADTNPTTTTATGPTTAIEVDLDIANGQGGALLDDDKEETPGAFTVANLNDTDNDGAGATPADPVTPDKDDNDVRGTPPNGRPEVDLMKLMIQKPQPDMGGNVTLRVVSGSVKLWEQSWKGTEVTLTNGQREYAVSALPKTLWVEARAASPSLRDIVLTAEYSAQGKTVTDTVKATGIWVWQVDSRDDANDSSWDDITTPPLDRIAYYGGYGLRPVSTFGVRNVIGIRFQLSPDAIWSQQGVRFDVGRTIHSMAWEKHSDGNWTGGTLTPWPPNPESANDDPNDGDESSGVGAGGVGALGGFFSEDPPGPDSPIVNDLVFGLSYKGNMREFLRVSFDGQRPTGNGLHGSRCSNYFDWHPRHLLERDPNHQGPPQWWRRTTGDSPETVDNDVAPGLLDESKPDSELNVP
jgi:hypothetical protein